MLSNSQFPAPSIPEVDAFPASARLQSYVPLPSREQVAAYLSAKLLDEPGVVELSGISGVGKSLMMRVVAQRLAHRFVAIRVPIPTLSPDEFATWIDRATHGQGTWRPRDLWQRLRTRGRPRLLLVEDAQELPSETAAWIVQWCQERDGRALLAYTEELGSRSSSSRRAFLEPLELSEIGAYVESHLTRIDAPPEVRRLFQGEAAHSLALRSGGIPRNIHRLADERLLALAALRSDTLAATAALGDEPRRTDKRARGDLLGGVSGALFLASLTMSVPSPLSDGPELPPPSRPRPQNPAELRELALSRAARATPEPAAPAPAYEPDSRKRR